MLTSSKARDYGLAVPDPLPQNDWSLQELVQASEEDTSETLSDLLALSEPTASPEPVAEDPLPESPWERILAQEAFPACQEPSSEDALLLDVLDRIPEVRFPTVSFEVSNTHEGWTLQEILDVEIPWSPSTKGEEHDLAEILTQLDEPQGPNRTSQFLDMRLKHPLGMTHSDLYKLLQAKISQKLRKSAQVGQVEDHIQNYLRKLIQRDAFAEWLEAGNSIPNSRLVAFALNSSFTDLRDSAKNPVCRTFFGAKMKKELDAAKAYVEPDVLPKFQESHVSYSKADDMEESLAEVIDMNPTVDEVLMFRSIMQEIEDALKEERPKTWTKLRDVLALKMEGNTTKEIQEKLGLPTAAGASALLSEARQSLIHYGETVGFESFDVPRFMD